MRERNLNTMLLVDEYSRSTSKTNLAELSSMGVYIINNLRDINSSIVATTNKVVLLGGCMQKSTIYPDLVLFKEVFDLEYYFLSLDESLNKSMEHLATCYAMDPTVLDYNKVYSIIYDDPLAREGFLSSYAISEVEQIAEELSENPNTKVRKLADAYSSLVSLLSDKESRIRELSQELEIKDVKHQQVLERSDILTKYHHELFESAVEMSRSLSQYEVIFSKDIYDKVSLSQFPRKPNIIYLKEYEELVYFDSFLDTLFQTLRYQGRNKVKVLQLFDSSSSRKILRLPDKYSRLTNHYHESEVYSNDFLAKVGNYQDLLGILLTNTLSLDTLIIVDRKDHNDTVLKGSSFLELALCRNIRYCDTYGLQPNQTISNSPDAELSWHFFPEYATLSDEDKERFMFLSSRPVIRKIIQMHNAFRR